MKFKRILITGGAGFVGSNIAIKLKEKYPDSEIFTLDNLKRRGSELNLPRFKEVGIKFIHGDIRNKEDFEELQDIDLIFECSAEPSVLAGLDNSPSYLINTNLLGTINCLEFARKNNAHFIFISTSRVYPVKTINDLKYKEEDTRFSLEDNQITTGSSTEGIAENFPLEGGRSLYGATKLCSELLIQEYIDSFGLKAIINRCGVITGPWQMGKIDQGVFVLWVAKHIFGGKLSYIGYGGEGKQVRDFIHIDDLFNILDIQINSDSTYSGGIFNIGGGKENSISLQELTKICEEVTGNILQISSIKENRPSDLISFITDSSKIRNISGWKPKKGALETVSDIAEWINDNKEQLKNILS